MGIINYFLIFLAVFFVYFILRKTMQQKILERDSIRWFFLSIVIIIFGFFPDLLMKLAQLVGVEYAPSLLFLLSILVLLYFIFRQSIQISELNNKVRELAQRNAIIEQEIEEIEKLDKRSK